MNESLPEISPVLIVGAGLIGASIGCALRAKDIEVYLQDVNPKHAELASERGAGVVAEPSPDEIKLVVIATPPADIVWQVQVALEKYPNAAVTDTGSIKASLARDLSGAKHLDRYVGSHPMAGSAHSGPMTAGPELFADRIWVVTPSYDNPDWVVRRVLKLGQSTGARTIVRDVAQHDRAVAEISHLPQLMASLTAAQLTDVPDEDLQLAGQGVRDVTRIAASDSAMWRQIVAGNKELIRAQLVNVRRDLEELIASLDDPQAVTQFLEKGRAGRGRLPSRAGKDPSELVSITAEVPDEPGALAKLFDLIDEAGVNIEDVSIEHDPSRSIGYLQIQVSVSQADQLRSALKGWGR